MNFTQSLPIPGLLWGSYPEARTAERGAPWWYAAAASVVGGFGSARRFARAIEEARKSPATLEALRSRLARGRLDDALIAESFVLINAACQRELGFAAYPTQLLAARLMLANRIVEMATGEGKTVAALFAAATAALAGVPVHVITANDYLAARDAADLKKLYAALGLRVGAVRQGMSAEACRKAYACDVTYCSAKELVFDYLRDSLALREAGGDLERRAARLAEAPAPKLALRGLCMAIVDEADSILIDEARVPFVLSQAASAAPQAFHAHALRLARTLESPRDYTLDVARRAVSITPQGCSKLAPLPQAGSALERSAVHLKEAVCHALTALHLLKKDRDYVLAKGGVLIVEPSTGRPARGRAWARGLQQLVELKEGVAPSARPQTVAQITYQRFFARYLRLCGMSGTVQEARVELLSVYGCRVARVQPRKPSRRTVFPSRFFTTPDARWAAVVERVREMQAAGRPVLVGTASVAESEALSRRLTAEALPHAVLNARHDAEEAAIVAAAGEAGRITIATNMAGRGTDIALGRGVAERGGLHVILCQHNASRRIDRQFLGRCARRGEPGSCEILLALDDLPQSRALGWLKRRCRAREELPRALGHLAASLARFREEIRHRAQRRRLREADAQAERSLPLHRSTSTRNPAHAR